jgi:transposase
MVNFPFVPLWTIGHPLRILLSSQWLTALVDRLFREVKPMKTTSSVINFNPAVELKSEYSCERLITIVFLLLVSMLSENAALRKKIEALTAKGNEDSKNSDRPPSTNSPFKKKPSDPEKKGKPGASKGHPGHRQVLLTPQVIVPVKPERCKCGNTHFPVTHPFYTHQSIELPPIQMKVTHFVLHEGTCPRCGRLNKAQVPHEHESGYGPRLTALIAEMSGCHGNSRGSVQTFLRSVFGLSISRGAIQRVIDRTSEAIKPLYEAIGQVARQAKVNYVDETPWFQNGVLMWLWVMVNPSVAFFKVQTSRSKEAFKALVDNWAGILVSDGYGAYRNWVNAQQACLAHLIRRATGLSQRHDPELAWFGRRTLAELQRLISWAHAPPTKGEASMWYARMVHLIARYRGRKDDGGRFARHLQKLMGDLWLFLLEDGVEPTNNRAERALRFAVIWRRLMQGTSSEKGDRWVERILSVKETCRLKGMSTFDVLVDAVTCYFKGQAPDVSWVNQSAQQQAL